MSGDNTGLVVFPVRVDPDQRRRMLGRAAKENAGNRSAWGRRAFEYALANMPPDWHNRE